MIELDGVRLGGGAEVFGVFRGGLVVREQGAATAGGDDLVTVEAGGDQAALGADVGVRTGHATLLVSGAEAFRAVFDEEQTELVGEFGEGIDIAHAA